MQACSAIAKPREALVTQAQRADASADRRRRLRDRRSDPRRDQWQLPPRAPPASTSSNGWRTWRSRFRGGYLPRCFGPTSTASSAWVKRAFTASARVTSSPGFSLESRPAYASIRFTRSAGSRKPTCTVFVMQPLSFSRSGSSRRFAGLASARHHHSMLPTRRGTAAGRRVRADGRSRLVRLDEINFLRHDPDRNRAPICRQTLGNIASARTCA